MWVLALFLLTLLLAYVFVARPILHRLPALKAFYADADTIWQKVAALAWRSATVAWSYLMAAVGAVLQAIDAIGAALGDPNLRDQISAAIGDPQTVGRILLGVSLITLLARLRSISKAA